MERTIDELMDELNNHPDFICGQIHTKRSVRHDMFSFYKGILTDENQINELLNLLIDQFKPQIIRALESNDDYYWDVINELMEQIHNNEKKYQKNGQKI